MTRHCTSRLLIASLALIVLAFVASASSARADGPAWSVDLSHYPTKATPGKSVYLAVLPTNVGTARSVGVLTAKVTVPAGVTITAMNGTAGGWICTLATTSCLNFVGLAAGTQSSSATIASAGGFSVTASVDPGVVQDTRLTAKVTISGGGAPACDGVGQPVCASATDQIPIDASSSDYGIDNFTASAIDATGRNVTQAGGHPWLATTAFGVNTSYNPDGTVAPNADVRTTTVGLPPGFVGNPQAVPQCRIDLHTQTPALSLCPADTQVGRVVVINSSSADVGVAFQGSPVYNIVPEGGHPAEFGFAIGQAPQLIPAEVRSDGTYAIDISAKGIANSIGVERVLFTFWGQPGLLNGGGDAAPFLSNPTDCSAGPPVTTLTTDSWINAGQQDGHENAILSDPNWKTASYTSPALTGCDQLAFDPSISLKPASTQADTPTAYSVHVRVPQTNDASALATPSLKDATVTLPAGASLSPGTADGLEGCTDDQIGLHSLDAATCPDGSKIGTVHVATPLLPSEDGDYLPDGADGTHYQLNGSIYLRKPDSGADRTGLYSMFLDVEDARTGIMVKLRGNVVPDEATGQLTARFTDNPQLPFTDFLLQFKGGSRAPLTNPPTCGVATTTSTFSSWGGPSAMPSDSFAVSLGAGGGPCVTSVAGLPFAPDFSAGLTDARAGGSSPFVLRFTRQDGEQDLGSIDTVLPAGLLADIRAVPQCPEAQAAAGTCSAASQIGTTTVGAGAGATPLFVPQAGKAPTAVYLAGPYKGAPFSLSIVVPAQAGPFDLGTVVVRAALFVDQNDAHVTVKSDPLPTILQGTPLRIRDVRVIIDRPGFMRSPTNCDPAAVAADITSAAGKSAHVSNPFQTSDCAALPFAPKLAMKLTDKSQTKDGGHPGVVASLTQQNGEAALKSASVTLPLSLALDPDNANALCEFTDGLKDACPASSIVGTAKAVSPILDQPLTGPVYFVKGVRQNKEGRLIKTLPTLLVELTGENGLRIDLRATSDVDSQSRLVTTFPAVPDAPISSFVLNINGGKHGIIVVTDGKDVCKDSEKPFLAATGQNGKREDTRVPLTPECGVAVARTFTATSVHARVTGIGAGTVTVSGTGVRTTKRTIKSAASATVIAKLTAKGKHMRKAGQDVRLKVSFVPKGAKKAVVAYSTAPKKARKSVA